MHQFLHDYFWIYIVLIFVIVVLFGAVYYFTPKLAMKFLDKSLTKNNSAAPNKNAAGETAGAERKK